MYIECRHVLPSGRKCTEGLVRDSQFCYRHRNLHESLYAPPARPGTPFRMPLLEDSHGCLIGVQEVTWAMGDKRIAPNEAGIYLRAITIAKSLIPRRPAVSRKPVRSLCYDNDGIEMAELVNACEPPRDCITCEKHCHWFEYYEDEVEELEQQMAEEEQKKLAAQQAETQSADPSAPQPQSEQTAQSAPPRSVAQQRSTAAGHSATTQHRPSTTRRDYDTPNVRALFNEMRAEGEEAERQRLQAEQQAQSKASSR